MDERTAKALVQAMEQNTAALDHHSKLLGRMLKLPEQKRNSQIPPVDGLKEAGGSYTDETLRRFVDGAK